MLADQWEELANKLAGVLDMLHNAGADFGLISANTPHAVFDQVVAKCPIPLVSIVEETCEEVVRRGLSRVGLLGTAMTMQMDFYQKVFRRHGIQIVVPNEGEQAYIQDRIMAELARGLLLDETRQEFLRIGQRMVDELSIQGLVLGCTEIPLLLTRDELGIPFLDTGKIHVQSALNRALS